ncbi:hypothetical protein F0L74_09825 [Chitinophaga agrisoli]|uniref:Phage head morphogenesis domain-containing protein n=1 Tax=Chitinophaga agrisoli TaxID=2607653 RepID=A0A5B2VX29_9BACT|nr:minor capsid protein [Chitinophaga agrisoli]KAA2242817.1 hypothetical protein F0L74_09825 [Chitinophaga agrisoli]
MFEFSEEQITRLLAAIYNGSVQPYALPDALYYAIADYIKKGLYAGFGGGLSDFAVGGKDFELLDEMRENVYMFSGAKTYQQVKVMSELLTEGETIMPFADFKVAARGVFDQYNVAWLRTEYDTAIGQGHCAVKWNSIMQNADVLPMLEYDAVMDQNTSDICRPLNGVRLPVNDPFWRKYAPLNHFNCRCLIRQLEDGRSTSKSKIEGLESEVGDKMQDIFKMNPGIDRVVFSDKHPYFDVAPKDREYAARNFDLPIPKSDRA